MRKFEVLLLALTLLPGALLFASPVGQPNDAAPAATGAQSQALPALPARKPSVSEEDRITREVRHELLMLPYYTLFDWLAFRVNGSTVELLGAVNTLGLKRDAVSVVKHIEGVDNVIDHIDQLPPSPMDNRIRRAVARAIFTWGSNWRYSESAVPSIHIIVKNGRVTLEGIVDNQADKDAAGIRANGVPGVFQVTNNLIVSKS
jgi:hyperosmotically inducible protein